MQQFCYALHALKNLVKIVQTNRKRTSKHPIDCPQTSIGILSSEHVLIVLLQCFHGQHLTVGGTSYISVPGSCDGSLHESLARFLFQETVNQSDCSRQLAAGNVQW